MDNWESWYWALVFTPPVLGSILGALGPIKKQNQYRILGKVRPPPWVFGVAWSILYTCIGAAWAFALSENESDLWITQEKINTAWIIYPIFFFVLFTWTYVYNMSVRSGLYYLVFSIFILVCAYSTSPMISKLLLSPMFAWLYFAGLMNYDLAKKLA